MAVPYNPNPGPRAALRKAADADLHPVASPRRGPDRDEEPVRSHIAAVPNPPTNAPSPDAVAGGGAAGGKKVKKGKQGKADEPRRMFQGATSDVMRHPEPRERDVLLGKQADLTVRIPKRLRKAARAQAERRGTTVDDVVTGLLAGWVDGS